MIVQNTDTLVRITLKDSDGVAIDLSTLSDYEIYVYRKEGNDKILIKTFKSSNTGFYGIVVNDAPTAKVDIILNREMMNTVPAGKIYAEVRLRKIVTSEFISSSQNLGENELEIGEVVTSSNITSLL